MAEKPLKTAQFIFPHQLFQEISFLEINQPVFLVEEFLFFKQYKLQSAEIPLLPELVRLEKNNGYNSITGADNLLRIRNANNWSKCTLTGLRPTETKYFYYSDLPIHGVKSLCVIKYTPETEIIEIRVCKQFYPYNSHERTRIVNTIIQNF